MRAGSPTDTGQAVLFCLGLSHQTAPVEVRERYALPQTEEVLRELAALDGVTEAALLSTCNRVEIYAAGELPRAAESLRARLSLRDGSRPDDFAHFYELGAEQAVPHLFRVACGMESMVFGETEIFGQVKAAYAGAMAAGTAGRQLNLVFQRAFQAAKQVRASTGITRGSVSVGSVAADLAERIFGDLRASHIMIMGAGDTSEKTARALLARGARGVFVSNRSYDRAAVLAAELGGVAVHFDEWEGRLGETDIIISSTSAPHHVVRREQIEKALPGRRDRPLFLIDLAVPRDIDPAVDGLDGVYRYDIDSLEGIAREAMDLRKKEIHVCEEIIARHAREVLRRLRPQADGCALSCETGRAAGGEGGVFAGKEAAPV